MRRGRYDNEDHSIKRMVITLLILFIIAAGSFLLIVKLLGSTGKKTVKANGTNVEETVGSSASDNKDQENAEQKEKETAKQTENEQQQNQQEAGIDSSQYTIEQLYYEIHLRANSIIIAEDDEIWEEMSIDKEFINYTIELVKDKDETLYNMLLPWKNLDFSNAVEVHNYVWEKLGGTVGKATGLNQDAINSLVQSLSQ